MESNKPNQDNNLLPSTSSGILPIDNNNISDFQQFSYMTVPDHPWNNMNGSHSILMQGFSATGGYSTTNPLRHTTHQNPQCDPNFADMQIDVPIVTPSRIANPGEMHQSVNRDFTLNPDSMMNRSINFGSFQNSPMNGNYSVSAESSTDNSQINNRNLPKSEGIQMVDVNSNQFGCLGKIDGSFLSLGSGGNEGSRSKPTFGTKEIALHLNSSNAPQTTTRDFSSLGHNLNSGISGSQGNVTGVDRSASCLAGWPPNNPSNSNAVHGFQARQVNKQYKTSLSSKINPVSNKPIEIVNLDPEDSSEDDQVSSSRAFVANKPVQMHGFGQFGPAQGSANGADRVQQSYMRPTNNSAGSLMVSPFPVPTNPNRSGQLVPTHERYVAQAQVQVPIASPGTFPRRPGFQDGNHQAGGVMAYNGMPVQSGISQNFSRPIHPSPRNFVSATGWPRGAAAFQLPVHVPSSTTGQLLHSDKTMPAYAPVQQIQSGYMNNVIHRRPLYRAPLKRSAVRPPADVPSTSRRTKPTPRTPQNAPVPNFTITPHIKSQVLQEVCKPIEEKCMICKRGLSYTPEGEMLQLDAPPAIAILPCGHTFHDFCLERITSKDQASDPPCIPCAMNET